MPRIGALGSTRVEVPHRQIVLFLKRHVICELLKESIHGEDLQFNAPGCLNPSDKGNWVFNSVAKDLDSDQEAERIIDESGMKARSATYEDVSHEVEMRLKRLSNDESAHFKKDLRSVMAGLFAEKRDGGMFTRRNNMPPLGEQLANYFKSAIDEYSSEFMLQLLLQWRHQSRRTLTNCTMSWRQSSLLVTVHMWRLLMSCARSKAGVTLEIS